MKSLLQCALRLALSMAARLPPAKALQRRLQLEELESRALPSAAGLSPQFAAPDSHATPLAASASATYTPDQIRHAYGFDRLPFNGAGQTIAVVDAFDDPNILADLRTFDQTFGLPDPPSFAKKTPEGAPPMDGLWAGEISLDVEWAHAVAPGAHILLVEAKSDSFADLLGAVDYARRQPGVSVVSMSWGGTEFNGETAQDATFTTPAGHGGVLFIASSGDNGAGTEWPAVSPNVLAVGGTTLSLNAQGAYGGETAWSGSGGGRSWYEIRPQYQRPFQGFGQRTVPDVAYNADPNTGFYVYDSVPDAAGDVGWFSYGGTSAGAPQWAALVALADQGRAQVGLGPLASGPAAFYSLSSADFHDITTGSNGYAATPGYDFVTGRGSPRADLVVADLVRYGAAPALKTTATTTKSSTSTATRHAAATRAAAPLLARTPASLSIAEWRLYLHAGASERPDDDAGGPFRI